MRKVLTLFPRVFIVLGLAGTAAAEDRWVNVGGKYSVEEYQVDLPLGWKRAGNPGNSVQLTKDGLALQEILVMKRSVEQAFANTKKSLSSNMLPQEVAQVLVDDFMSNSNITNQTIQENRPENIDQHAGFRVVYSFKTKGGLSKKAVFYGFLDDKSLYLIKYDAAAKYYFARDVEVFEKVKDSFRLEKKPSSP